MCSSVTRGSGDSARCGVQRHAECFCSHLLGCRPRRLGDCSPLFCAVLLLPMRAASSSLVARVAGHVRLAFAAARVWPGLCKVVRCTMLPYERVPVARQRRAVAPIRHHQIVMNQCRGTASGSTQVGAASMQQLRDFLRAGVSCRISSISELDLQTRLIRKK